MAWTYMPDVIKSIFALQESVVFVVGGGNYMEYNNLVNYAKKKAGATNKKIIYGCTDVVNAEQFLNQVSYISFLSFSVKFAITHELHFQLNQMAILHILQNKLSFTTLSL